MRLRGRGDANSSVSIPTWHLAPPYRNGAPIMITNSPEINRMREYKSGGQTGMALKAADHASICSLLRASAESFNGFIQVNT
jgi:hypothetical protein